jgi:NAD(P)-dependent dehydrogenase (short-subunit alcohol dehydrogenase family)
MASVLITGTSKGIGLETALAFGRAGHLAQSVASSRACANGGSRKAANHRLRDGCGLGPVCASCHRYHSEETWPYRCFGE